MKSINSSYRAMEIDREFKKRQAFQNQGESKTQSTSKIKTYRELLTELKFKNEVIYEMANTFKKDDEETQTFINYFEDRIKRRNLNE